MQEHSILKQLSCNYLFVAQTRKFKLILRCALASLLALAALFVAWHSAQADHFGSHHQESCFLCNAGVVFHAGKAADRAASLNPKIEFYRDFHGEMVAQVFNSRLVHSRTRSRDPPRA